MINQNRTLALFTHQQSKEDIGFVVARGRSAPVTYCAATNTWSKNPAMATVYATPSEAQAVIAALPESHKAAKVMKLSQSSQYVALSEFKALNKD